DIGARQRQRTHQLVDVPEFGALGTQEFAPRRHGVEQVAHLDGGAHRMRRGLWCARALRFDAGAAIVPRAPRGDRHPRYRCDRSQRLAAKAHARDTRQVIEARDLAGRVRRQRQRQFVRRDARAVVAHADQAHATLLDLDIDATRTGIEAVLGQLLHHRRGAFDHLTGGDLVDQFRRKRADGWHDARRLLANRIPRNDAIARHVLAAGQLHALLRHEALQQRVERVHEFRIAMDFVRTILFDLSHALFLDVARDDAGKRAAHVRRQLVWWPAAMQIQCRHRRVGGLERLLERQVDVQFPVEEKRVVLLDAMVAHHLDALLDRVRHRDRILDDDLVTLRGGFAQHQSQEPVDLLEILRGGFGSREHQRERYARVDRVQQDAEQVQDFLAGADATGEHDEAMADAHEGFEALLDVRQDHQAVDDGVRRFGGDDAGFAEADVTILVMPLLGVRDGRALHRPLHRAGPAARADVHPAQAELVADRLGVVVFLARNGMAAPADHEVRIEAR